MEYGFKPARHLLKDTVPSPLKRQAFLHYTDCHITESVSVRLCWGGACLVIGFKVSIMLEKDGRFHGSLQFYQLEVLIEKQKFKRAQD